MSTTTKNKKILIAILVPIGIVMLGICIFLILFAYDTSFDEPPISLVCNRTYKDMKCISVDREISPGNYDNAKPLVYWQNEKGLSLETDYYLNGEDMPFFKNKDGDETITYADDDIVCMIVSYWKYRITLCNAENNMDAHKYDEAYIYDRAKKECVQVIKTGDKMQFLVDFTGEYYVIYNRDENTVTRYSCADNSVIQTVDVKDRIYYKHPVTFALNSDVCVEFNENNIVDVFSEWAD